jgi:gamma-glutamyltranspeptidase/glutathione hydrolase
MNRLLTSRRAFLKQSSAVLAVGCSSRMLGRHGLAAAPAGENGSGKSNQAVACSRREAAEAARDVLLRGGNAIDAAVAALIVQCVIEPANVGIGGYGGSLVYCHGKSGHVHAIDFTSRAPRKFDPATFSESTGRHGYLAVGVPGILAGVDVALREYGTMPFKALARPALALAENGIRVTPQLARSFNQLAGMDAVSRRAYFSDGVPAQGATWVQADLARLIRRLGEEGLASFYTGDIAGTIARQVQAGGGVLTEEDFRGFRAAVVEPLSIDYRGYLLYTPPLPSGGPTSLNILTTLEQFNLSRLTPRGADYIELFAGASNLAWQERFGYFGDPDFVKVPVENLLSEERARARAKSLRDRLPPGPVQPSEPLHTVNIVVADKEQNLVSWTATHGGGFGSHVAIKGLGLMLGHGMSRFTAKTGDPNYPAPGKRPQHNMAPLVILKRGKPYAGLGLPGGRFIVTVTAQLAINLIDFKLSPRAAITAPRIHNEGDQPIRVTSNCSAATVEQLRQRGHRVEVKQSLGGDANVVVVEPTTNNVQAAASPGSSGVLIF